MIKIKLKNKKNPIDRNVSLDQLLFEILPGQKILIDQKYNKSIYKFRVSATTNILGKKFIPGDYILKYYKKNLSSINELLTLSSYKLIPKIYIITDKFIIMKFVKGANLNHVLFTLPKYLLHVIINNLEQAILLWHKLGFFHGDIGEEGKNVIVDTVTFDVYLIDPIIDDYEVKSLSQVQREYLFQRDLDRIQILKTNLSL